MARESETDAIYRVDIFAGCQFFIAYTRLEPNGRRIYIHVGQSVSPKADPSHGQMPEHPPARRVLPKDQLIYTAVVLHVRWAIMSSWTSQLAPTTASDHATNSIGR